MTNFENVPEAQVTDQKTKLSAFSTSQLGIGSCFLRNILSILNPK
jgi:hypothetical protein